jgi:UDP-2-acetamido-2-deoxy-ribo-hexuluronate aminotransferase
MVDLAQQYQKIESEINQAISEVLKTATFINGPQVRKFENELEEYLQINHCISCANGTDALQIAMMALDLKPGDEVIVPAFSYISTAEAAALLGLKLVLVDVDPDTYNISTKSLYQAFSPRTKLIIPVHLFGQCAPMEEILSFAKKNHVYVVEDAAQALGSEYTFSNGKKMFAGTMGTIGISSFFPSKNLGCYGDGGALFTNDDNLAKRIKMICNHGQEKKYYHDKIGVNSRLDSVQAAILSIKLKQLPFYTQKRQQVAAFYDTAFSSNPHFEVPKRNSSSTHVFNQYTLKLNSLKRNDLKIHLEARGIPSMIYYPLPIHFQKAYSNLGFKKGMLPVSEKISECVLSLPIDTEIDEEQLTYIAENTLNFFLLK